jgi:hypothetical protein
MAHNSRSHRRRGAPRRASPDDPYCEFQDDRERRNALVSRDLRIVGCRLVTMAGLVTLALYTPPPAAWSELSLKCSRAFLYSHKERSYATESMLTSPYSRTRAFSKFGMTFLLYKWQQLINALTAVDRYSSLSRCLQLVIVA